MVTVTEPQDDVFAGKQAAEELTSCPQLCSQGSIIPIYCFGTQSFLDDNQLRGLSPEEEQSILDCFLLAQWEDQTWKGRLKYDVTTSEIKVICGKRKFLAQLNDGWNMDYVQEDPEEDLIRCQRDEIDLMKNSGELLFCVATGDKAYPELISSAAVPSGAVMIFINVNPIEYGHICLVPYGFSSHNPVMDARSLEMILKIAIEINNHSFHLFYNCSRCTASEQYFQGCYFPDPFPVECTPVHTLFVDGKRGIRVSTVTGYPIRTLLFESTCSFIIMAGVLAEICSFLMDKNIHHNLLVSDCGRKIYVFLLRQTSSPSCNLSAWECGGYFLFRSRQEFDQVTEAALVKHLNTLSLDEEGFEVVKQLCCCVARKMIV